MSYICKVVQVLLVYYRLILGHFSFQKNVRCHIIGQENEVTAQRELL